MDFLQFWGRWIQSACKAKGYTIQDLSRLTQISANQIYSIEKGNGDSRRETLRRILDVLGEDSAYNAVLTYVEPNIDAYLPLIQELEQLPPKERDKAIQQFLNLFT